jgi:hypothetical protein
MNVRMGKQSHTLGLSGFGGEGAGRLDLQQA